MNDFAKSMRQALLGVAIVIAAAAAPLAVASDDTRVNRDRNGVGIRGYDPVAYFDGAPMPGKKGIEYTFEGTTSRFSTEANRDRFVREPSKYLPQYGGFCAYAVSRGYTASIDPLAWKIVNGKLYLNYSRRVQQLWEEDIPGNIDKADANWPTIVVKP